MRQSGLIFNPRIYEEGAKKRKRHNPKAVGALVYRYENNDRIMAGQNHKGGVGSAFMICPAMILSPSGFAIIIPPIFPDFPTHPEAGIIVD